MNWVDFSILGIIAVSTLISLIRGFVKEAISLVVWFAALFISSNFYADLAVYFTAIDDPYLKNGAAIAALFVSNISKQCLQGIFPSNICKQFFE